MLPRLKGDRQALEYIMRAIEKAGYKAGDQVSVALDVAATELFEGGKYKSGRQITHSARVDRCLRRLGEGFSSSQYRRWFE